MTRADAPPEKQPTSIDDSVDQRPEPEGWGWTQTHRIGIGIIVSLFVAILIFAAWRRPGRVGDGSLIVQDKPLDLPVNMDPNTATAGALSRIPGIGEKLATKIVDYREIHRAECSDGIVYRKLDDMAKDAGITNKKTLAACRTYLVFPDEPEAAPHGLTPPAHVQDAVEEDLDDASSSQPAP